MPRETSQLPTCAGRVYPASFELLQSGALPRRRIWLLGALIPPWVWWHSPALFAELYPLRECIGCYNGRRLG